LWSDGFLWSEGYLWPDVVADAQPLYSISPLGVELNDD
jgi:hypothetical protein